MRQFFSPSEAPFWLKNVLNSIREALADVWNTALRLKDYTTAGLPPAADWKQGVAYDSTTTRVVFSDGSSWTGLQNYDADLAAIAALSTTGLIARTGAGTAATRTITAPAAGITVTNGDGVAGNPTLALANDLAALEGLGSTGIAARTGADAWAQRTIAGTAPITVSNGDGVAGNPTVAVTGAALTKADDTNVTLTLGGSPTSALLAAASLTLGWSGTLAVSRGGTGTGTAFTQGSVVFAGASGIYSQDNANLFWDDANNRLGIGTSTPQRGLHVNGQINVGQPAQNTTSSNYVAVETASDPITVERAAIEFGTSAGGSSSDSYIAFITNQYGVSRAERARISREGHFQMGSASTTVIDSDRLFRLRTYTAAGLPAAGTAGRAAFVTDANATTFASVVAGGGANGVPVYDDGTNWRIG